MLQQFFYQEKGLFLQSLHSAVALCYIAVLLVLALAFSHPVYLAGIFIVTALAIWAADGIAVWEGYLKIALWMVFLVMVINPLVVRAGQTVLWHGPYLPVLGRLTITLEAICYGAAMGVRLLDMISIFCLYNLTVHPDRLLNLFSRFAYKSALVVSLATRLFPVMTASMSSIREMQQLRGVDFQAGTLKERVGKYASLFNILLVSSLEGSLQMAEAMQARAFGSGPRSCYRREFFRPRDGLCLAGSIFSLIVAIYGIIHGFGTYTYYPQLGYLFDGSATVTVLAAVLGGLSLPAGLSWGWQRCQYLRSKI
ncbi:MAG: energy-coupling factor transporter transmembrane protein EcfT [Pelotomaculum sp.]|nr:energy-coupling factor transporter transmembrane protein EcfT [Pelotomaculum sp.]